MLFTEEQDKFSLIHHKYSSQKDKENYDKSVKLYENLYNNIGFDTTYKNITTKNEAILSQEARSNDRQQKLKDINEYLESPFISHPENENPYYDISIFTTFKNNTATDNSKLIENNSGIIETDSKEKSEDNSSSNKDIAKENPDSSSREIDPEKELQQLKKQMQKEYIDELREQMEFNKKKVIDRQEQEKMENDIFENRLNKQQDEIHYRQEVEDHEQLDSRDRLKLVNQKLRLEGILDLNKKQVTQAGTGQKGFYKNTNQHLDDSHFNDERRQIVQEKFELDSVIRDSLGAIDQTLDEQKNFNRKLRVDRQESELQKNKINGQHDQITELIMLQNFKKKNDISQWITFDVDPKININDNYLNRNGGFISQNQLKHLPDNSYMQQRTQQSERSTKPFDNKSEVLDQELASVSAFNFVSSTYRNWDSKDNSITEKPKQDLNNSSSMPKLSKQSENKYKDLKNYLAEKSILSDDMRSSYYKRDSRYNVV